MAALLPVTLWLDESAHFWLFCTLVPAAVLAAWNGFRTHRQLLPISLMIAGVVLVGLGTFLPMSSVLETAITVAGSLLLIAGHRLNGRLILIHRIAMQST